MVEREPGAKKVWKDRIEEGSALDWGVESLVCHIAGRRRSK